MLLETRVSRVQKGDLLYFEFGWVTVVNVDVKHPDDRVTILFSVDDDIDVTEIRPAGFEVAVVKREIDRVDLPSSSVEFDRFLAEKRAAGVDDRAICHEWDRLSMEQP